jgi:hypothetical protein
VYQKKIMGNCCSNHKDIIYPTAKYQPIAGNSDALDEFVRVNRAPAHDEVVELDSAKLSVATKQQKMPKLNQIDDSNLNSRINC